MSSARKQFSASPARRGFTLIELIIALSIVAVISVSLFASLKVAFRAQSTAETSIEPSRTAELAMEFLRQDIENAMPPADTTGGTTLATGKLVGNFVGTDQTDGRGHPGDDLVFFTTANATDHPSANGEIKKIELLTYVPENSNVTVLARRVTRNLLTNVTPTPDEEILCRGISGFNLRYFDGTDWQDAWDTGTLNVLPAAVEVTIELERPTADGQMRTLRYARVFQLACAADASDTPDAVQGVGAP